MQASATSRTILMQQSLTKAENTNVYFKLTFVLNCCQEVGFKMKSLKLPFSSGIGRWQSFPSVLTTVVLKKRDGALFVFSTALHVKLPSLIHTRFLLNLKANRTIILLNFAVALAQAIQVLWIATGVSSTFVQCAKGKFASHSGQNLVFFC